MLNIKVLKGLSLSILIQHRRFARQQYSLSKILITVGQGPIALAVGAGGGGLDIFTLIYPFSSFSLSLGDGPI